jgi:hypothetical protein
MKTTPANPDKPANNTWMEKSGGILRATLGRRAAYGLYATHQRLRDFPIARSFYQEYMGRPLNLDEPRTFNEKITWLKIHDRNPVLPIIADKVRVRDFIAQRIGPDLLVPLIGVYKRAGDIRKETLPSRFMAKVNFGSGLFIPVWDMETVDWPATIAQLDSMLRQPQPYKLMEWYQHHIPPRIIVEELLLDSRGEVPSDIKLFVFHGKVHLAYCLSGRYGRKALTFYWPSWDFIPELCRHAHETAQPKPSRLEEMIHIAEILGAGFPFLRVDFYNPDDRLYIGELTPHPYSGLCTMITREYDERLGALLVIGQAGRHYWKHRVGN